MSSHLLCHAVLSCYVDNYVGGSSKIQTLCYMTQVLLKLRFTTMERLTGYCFLHLPMSRYITNYYIYYPQGISHTHFN